MKMKSFFRLATLAAAAALVFVAFGEAAQADEGMWTFDNFPSKTVGVKYGFAPSPDWLDHVRLSSLRIAGGCSASFISPHGLVMTNHHCVVDCLEQISTPEQNFAGIGYSATTPAEERKCPDFELDQLVEIRDVTKEIQAATAGKTGDGANKALHAKEAELQQSCGSDQSARCDVVSLYHGGVYDLYHYKRYNDVRLVFAPEFSVAQFGGDPDNFNFPRFDFDIGVLRAYETDKPAATKDYLHWSANGSKDGDLVFVSGNPGGTFRELTTSQLAFERDVLYPHRIPEISERRGELEAFIARGPQQGRAASDDLFFLENGLKVYFGRQQALLDPQFFGSKMQEEQKLRAATAADPKLAAYVSAWDDIERIQHVRSQLFVRATELSDRAFRGALLGNAITLVRAAAERTKPNSERLPQFTDQALVAIERELAAPAPVYPDLEELNLAFLFTVIRRDLGTDDAFVRKMLGKESPEQLAHRLVSGTNLGDAKVREELYKGGQALIAASTDPMIRFAALINDDLLSVRKDYEARVDAPTRAAAEKIADARFAIFGTSVDPDATFTLRLTYGTVKGFEDAQGKFVQPYTAIGGLYERATGAPPYNLPESWLTSKGLINPMAPMNFCTTNDTTGGNSGSPVIDKNANIVGLLFDGNIFSLGGDYGYDAAKNRSIAVDSRVLLEGMRKVYHLNRVVAEIEAAR